MLCVCAHVQECVYPGIDTVQTKILFLPVVSFKISYVYMYISVISNTALSTGRNDMKCIIPLINIFWP